jgi:hypothetical protein
MRKDHGAQLEDGIGHHHRPMKGFFVATSQPPRQ